MEGKIKTSQTKGEIKGYQATFGEYIKNVRKQGKSEYRGTVDVDINKTAVSQIWTKVKATT